MGGKTERLGASSKEVSLSRSLPANASECCGNRERVKSENRCVLGDKLGPGPNYRIPTGGQPSPIPTEPRGQAFPGGDVFEQILTELGKAIQDGRLKPVVIGPIEIPIPGQAGPATQGQPRRVPGGDVLGQILRTYSAVRAAKCRCRSKRRQPKRDADSAPMAFNLVSPP
jgi:hypothetical protein